LIKLVFIILLCCVILYFQFRKFRKREIFGLKYGCFRSKALKGRLLYRYYIPKMELGKKYPVIVFLHGSKERGNNNKSHLNNASLFWVRGGFQQKFPSIVILPQCPKNKRWVNSLFPEYPFTNYNQNSIPESDELKFVMLLLKEFENKYAVDVEREFISGFSMGAYGSWDILTRYPKVFAAGIMVAGGADVKKLNKVKHIPLQIFYDKLDHIVPPKVGYEIHDEMVRLGGNCKITVFENEGHDCIDKALQTNGLVDWYMHQKRIL
jgi:predicted peptidase